jgi:hypothetical protein
MNPLFVRRRPVKNFLRIHRKLGKAL